MKKKIVIISILTFACIACFCVIAVYLSSNAGYRITKKELEFHKNIMRNEIRNYYYANFGLEVDSETWDKEVNGITPEEYLTECALNQSRLDRALFIIAHEEGLIEYDDYDGFLNALKRENESRRKDILAGKVVYGLTEFTPEEYYKHVMADIENELLRRINVDETEVKKYLDENKEEWVNNITTLYISDAIVDENGAVKSTKDYVFSNDSYSEDIKKCPEARIAAEKLEVGESQSYTDENGYLHTVTMLDKQIASGDMYAEYEQRARKKLALKVLESQVTDLAKTIG
ncbi:hypothetical protein SAMN02910368_00483 [Lachnospiraceae bacterium G11]|nr:hypothetical protein SAMN02910368_00483 [Lachnospiraceae bacterium G11]